MLRAPAYCAGAGAGAGAAPLRNPPSAAREIAASFSTVKLAFTLC